MGKVIQEVRAVYEDAKTKATELLEAILGLDSPAVTTPDVAVVDGDKQDNGSGTSCVSRLSLTVCPSYNGDFGYDAVDRWSHNIGLQW